jgi:uncharacterized membrane protein
VFGPIFLVAYRLLALCAWVLPARQRRALKAQWALRFSSMSDGGLDDDFAEEVFQIVRRQPDLLAPLQRTLRGEGFVAQRRRMTLDMVQTALSAGRQTTF